MYECCFPDDNNALCPVDHSLPEILKAPGSQDQLVSSSHPATR